MHIAIAGNIGSGKTTLTTLLSKHFKWKAHYEDVENNPYLNDFYKEMQRLQWQEGKIDIIIGTHRIVVTI